MLQPSASPVHGEQLALSSEPPRRTAPARPSLWQWINSKELIFIFVACGLGVFLFQTKDAFQLIPVWREALDKSRYANGEFPFDSEKLPPPVVTDIDSDGEQDIILLTYNNLLKVFTPPIAASNGYPARTIQEKVVVDLSSIVNEDVSAVAMTTGYLQKYQSIVQVRHQIVVLLMSDWTLLSFDHTLHLLWKVELKGKEGGERPSESCVLVTSVNIRNGDYGAVIVGGRELDLRKPDESINRMRRVVDERNEAEMLQTVGHFTVYAVEGRGGEVRWTHTPQDFQVPTAYPPESSPFRHLKLLMFRQGHHQGEVSWHQYSAAIREALPHSWQYSTDTQFKLAHFMKDKRPSEKSEIKDHISKVGDLAMEHMSGLAFGGQPPHAASEHIENPNVLILHSVKGLEVMHLYQGRPLCSLPLSPFHSSHVDINADGVIDHVSAINNPGEAAFFEMEGGGNTVGGNDCYGQALSMGIMTKPIFKHSICRATHWSESFITLDKLFPQLKEVGRKRVKDDLTEPLPPVLIPSSYHSAPLKLHMGGRGWDINSIYRSLLGAPTPYLPSMASATSPVATLYDSVFVLSSGRVTSIGPHGEFNWQVDTAADWDAASHVIYDLSHPSWNSDPVNVQFIENSFVPSAMAFSPKAYGKKDHILIMGWDVLTLLSGETGLPVTSVMLQDCHPVAPPQVVDFTGDGWNDVIVTCPDKYWGVSLRRKSGFWHTGLLGLLVGVVISVFAVYARQRTTGLLPPIKAAQD